MCKLPAVSAKEALAAFEKCGFVVVRTTGSHYIMKRPDHRFVLSIPIHGSTELKRGTLRSLIRTAGLTVQEFCDLL